MCWVTCHSIHNCCLHYSEARVCVVTSVTHHKMEDLQRQCMCTKLHVKLGKTDRQNATKSVSFLLTDQQEQSYECMYRPPRSLSCVTSFFWNSSWHILMTSTQFKNNSKLQWLHSKHKTYVSVLNSSGITGLLH